MYEILCDDNLQTMDCRKLITDSELSCTHPMDVIVPNIPVPRVVMELCKLCRFLPHGPHLHSHQGQVTCSPRFRVPLCVYVLK